MITRNLSILLTVFYLLPVFSSVLPETIDADISAIESKVTSGAGIFISIQS